MSCPIPPLSTFFPLFRPHGPSAGATPIPKLCRCSRRRDERSGYRRSPVPLFLGIKNPLQAEGQAATATMPSELGQGSLAERAVWQARGSALTILPLTAQSASGSVRGLEPLGA